MPTAPFLVMTDDDGDRWAVPIAAGGPMVELGKVGSDTVRVRLSWAPADAPLTFTATGDEAKRIELLVRQLAAQAHDCDATAVVEAIFLWEQEQLARQAAEQRVEAVRAEMRTQIDRITAELQTERATAEEAEKKRVATAQQLTKVDAQDEVTRLTEYANRLAAENERLSGKLVEARRQRDAARRKLARYEPETTIGDAAPELQRALAAAAR